MEKNLDDFVERMRNVGEQLVPYTVPMADARLEDELNFVKTKEVVIDGYELTINYGKSDQQSCYTESLQIIGKNSAFLPFNLVAKLARKFLGSHKLSLIEILKDNRKIYCWTVCTDRRGRPIDPPIEHQLHSCKHEGWEYAYMDPKQVKIY